MCSGVCVCVLSCILTLAKAHQGILIPASLPEFPSLLSLWQSICFDETEIEKVDETENK